MKKKFLATLLIAATTLSLVACGSSSSESKTDDSKTTATKPTASSDSDSAKAKKKKSDVKVGKVDAIDLNNEDGKLVYSKHEVSVDSDGNPAIRVYFTFTNNAEKSQPGSYIYDVKCFQNGVELDTGYADWDTPNEAEDNLYKSVQKDTSIEIAYLFTLDDETSEVTLQVTDYSNYDEDIYQEQALALQ